LPQWVAPALGLAAGPGHIRSIIIAFQVVSVVATFTG
jgi:hypothetical protein